MNFNVGDRVRLVSLEKFSHRERKALQDKVGVVVATDCFYFEVRLDEETELAVGTFLMRPNEVESE